MTITASEAAIKRWLVYLDAAALKGLGSPDGLSHRALEFRATPSAIQSVLIDPAIGRWVLLGLRKGSFMTTQFNKGDFQNPNWSDILFDAKLNNSKGKNVLVVSEAPKMRSRATSSGMQVTDVKGLREFVDRIRQEQAAAVEALETAEAETVIKERRLLFFKVIGGLCLGIAGVFAFLNLDRIVETVSVWGTLIILAAVAFGLYAIRGRFPLMYGMAEILVGFATAASTFVPGRSSPVGPKNFFAVLGGVYIVVRGLDNVGKGLKGTPYDSAWRKISGLKTNSP